MRQGEGQRQTWRQTKRWRQRDSLPVKVKYEARKEGHMFNIERRKSLLKRMLSPYDVTKNCSECNRMMDARTPGFRRAEKTMIVTDVTGFDAIFSIGCFAAFSRF